jgi:hypothetical protein
MVFRLRPIAEPCRASFSEMPGDTKVRFCSACNRHVYNLLEHTEAETRALFRERAGQKTCVRLARDPSGALRFKAAALAAAVSIAACSTHAPEQPVSAPPAATDVDMGDAIPDVADRCPDEPSLGADNDGCPEPDAGTSSDASPAARSAAADGGAQ